MCLIVSMDQLTSFDWARVLINKITLYSTLRAVSWGKLDYYIQ